MTEPLCGSRARYLRGCRCEPCRDAHRRYSKAYKHRTKADPNTGVPAAPMRLDATPVREHVRALLASGWTKAAIQREAGLATSHCSHLLSGQYRTVHRRVAARLLDLEPLRPVELDPVVVERLVAGGDWRALSATRAERLAAYEAARRAGESGKSARRRLGLAGRDTAVREAS